MIGSAIARQYSRSTLRGGEVLVSLVGNPGATAIAPKELAGANIARSVGLVPVADPIIARWVRHYLESPPGRALTLTSVIGSAQQVINLSDLAETPIPLPPAGMRDELVHVLDLFDEVLPRIAAVASAKRTRSSALGAELLTGRRRFPEFGGKWSEMALGDVTEGVTRRNGDRSEDRVLTCSGEHGLINQQEFFSKMVAGESTEDYYLLKRGEFAYNRSAMNGYPFGATKRLDRYEAGVLSTLNICFALKGHAWVSDFAVRVFESGLLNRQLRRITRVGSRAHGLLNVTKADFFELRIPVPSVAEQTRIANVLNALDREIALLGQLRAAYDAQKRALMQRLLSGGLTVREDFTTRPEPTHA